MGLLQVGAWAYLIAAYFGTAEAANAGLDSNVQTWKDHGCTGPRPKMSIALWPTDVGNHWLSYYGAFIQYFGAWLFGMSLYAPLAIARPGDEAPAIEEYV